MSDLMQKYLDKTVVFQTGGVTDFGTKTVPLAYQDVADQTSDFRDTLKYLLKYGILASRPKFE